jgi:hypothetical protein
MIVTIVGESESVTKHSRARWRSAIQSALGQSMTSKDLNEWFEMPTHNSAPDDKPTPHG